MKKSSIFILILFSIYKTISLLFCIFLDYIFHPTKLIKRREIYICPSFLQDGSYGQHKFVTVNSIKLHYVVSGPENAPVMLMLHGFPEFWYSWRFQIREFNKDFRVVAVDLRGYGESGKPPEQSAYMISTCVSDIVELIRTLDCGKCIILAHDWGGMFTWRLAYQRPDLVERCVIMCCPHPGCYQDLADIDYSVLLPQWYVLFYQLPWIPEKIKSRDNFHSIRKSLTGFTNRNKLTREDLHAFLYTLSQPGALTPPLNYYRNLRPDKIPKENIITIPTLVLSGRDDSNLSPRFSEGLDKYVKSFESRILNSSHWLQQDCPEEANALIREFLSKNFD